MSWLGGGRADPKTEQKRNERELRRTGVHLDRDKRQLDRVEKELQADIAKQAKAGNTAGARTLASRLVQLRKQRNRSQALGATVAGVSAQGKLMASQQRVAETMGSTAKTMGAMNKQIDPAKMAATMNEFSQQNTRMQMTDELMSDALDDMLTESGDEDEEAAVLERVLDEIGIEVKGQLAKAPAAPSGLGAGSQRVANQSEIDVDALLAQLK